MSTRVTAIVTTTYRYERPPRKRKAVALEVPAIVAIPDKKPRRVSSREDTPDAAKSAPANDDRKSAIVAVRKRSKLRGEPISPDAPEAADYEATTAHFRAVIASKLRK